MPRTRVYNNNARGRGRWMEGVSRHGITKKNKRSKSSVLNGGVFSSSSWGMGSW